MDVLPQRITELTEKKKTIVFFKTYFVAFAIANLCPPMYLLFNYYKFFKKGFHPKAVDEQRAKYFF